MSAPSPQRFLEALFPTLLPDENLELRVRLHSGRVFSCWVTDTRALMQVGCGQPQTADVWFGVATRQGRRGTAAHVSRILGLWSDVDFKCFLHGQRDALKAIERVALRPSCLIASGNGYHPYWLLVEPVIAAEDGARARGVLRGLQQHLGQGAARPLDAVHDLARVLRLPGTWNSKRPPPVPVEVLYVLPERRYRFEDFISAGIWHPNAPAPSFSDRRTCTPRPARLQRRSGALPPWVSDALANPAAHLRVSYSELDFAVLCALVPRVGPVAAEAIWLGSVLGARDKVQARIDYRARTLSNVMRQTTAARSPDRTAR